jgi:hypothetical protein
LAGERTRSPPATTRKRGSPSGPAASLRISGIPGPPFHRLPWVPLPPPAQPRGPDPRPPDSVNSASSNRPSAASRSSARALPSRGRAWLNVGSRLASDAVLACRPACQYLVDDSRRAHRSRLRCGSRVPPRRAPFCPPHVAHSLRRPSGPSPPLRTDRRSWRERPARGTRPPSVPGRVIANPAIKMAGAGCRTTSVPHAPAGRRRPVSVRLATVPGPARLRPLLSPWYYSRPN